MFGLHCGVGDEEGGSSVNAPLKTDWRDCLRGTPVALFDGKTVTMTTGKDKEAQSAVERLSERAQVARPGRAA